VRDIAQHTRLSPMTVSLALCKSPLVAETTWVSVQSSIESLGYVYQSASAILRTRSTHGARQIGAEAARLLLRRIKAPSGSMESIILPPKLIIRSSCGGGAPQ
jgi:DNA-binding LacI/PurR family transcriptional regulator